MLARELSRPHAWTDDVGRCERAGIPPARPLATTPPRARRRLERAFDATGPAAWVAGENRPLRAWWAERPQADGLTVSGKADGWRAGRQWQGKTRLAMVEEAGWGRWQAGDGPKGPRWDAGRWRPLTAPWPPHWRRWLVVRRSLSAPTERPASVGWAPEPTTRATVVQVGGRRWTIARCCEEATGEVGLDPYAVRHWTGWYRHLPLAMWASALLTVLRAGHVPAPPP